MKCPCHSGKEYTACCEPYHKGEQLPEKVELLMRSRYSAYALDLADYIIHTTHPKSPLVEPNRAKWLQSIHQFSHTTKFQDLIIEATTENTVTFHAILNTQGKNTSFREKSLFEKFEGRWCYTSPLTKNLD